MRAKFGWVVEVVDDVRAAGVDQLGLLTDQKKAGTMAPPPGATRRRRRQRAAIAFTSIRVVAIQEIDYEYGSRPQRGPKREHERHATD